MELLEGDWGLPVGWTEQLQILGERKKTDIK